MVALAKDMERILLLTICGSEHTVEQSSVNRLRQTCQELLPA